MSALLQPAPEPDHRAMVVADLHAVLAIEVQSYSHPWTRGNFVDSIAAGYDAELRQDARGLLIGYSVAMRGVEETHLLNLTVAPARRRQGHAQALLARVVDAARARGDGQVWLEVRASNTAARALYARCGFAEVGLRRAYYPDIGAQREDAVLMSLDLKPPSLAGGPDALV